MNINERNVTLSGQDAVSLNCGTRSCQAAAELTFANVTDNIPSVPTLIISIHVVPCLSVSGGRMWCVMALTITSESWITSCWIHEGIVGDLRGINQSRPPTGGTRGKVTIMTSQVASVCDLETFRLQRLIYPFVRVVMSRKTNPNKATQRQLLGEGRQLNVLWRSYSAIWWPNGEKTE